LKSLFLRNWLLFLIVFSQSLLALDKPYSYSYIPKKVYQSQVFPITIYAKHYNPGEEISFEFDPLSPLQPIDLTPVINQNQNEAFFTFYFKVPKNKTSIEIPTLTIWSNNFSYILNSQIIPVEKLDTSKSIDFTNLLASDFRVNNVKIDPYDREYIIVYLSLNAKEANLEDFHIPNTIDDGIEKLKREGANVSAKYYFIVKNSVKDISFSYFNTIKKKFISKKIDLTTYKNRVIKKDFSPKELTFDKLKKYILYGLTIFFILMFLLTKDKLYLFIFTLLVIFLGFNLFNKKTICIKEGASLYILPTTRSTIFTRVDTQINKEVIKKYKNFYKINLNENITGWIKDEDVCKN